MRAGYEGVSSWTRTWPARWSTPPRGWWLLVAGAAAALLMAMARWDYFWIANVIYLGFVLRAVGGSVLKLVAYRRGL